MYQYSSVINQDNHSKSYVICHQRALSPKSLGPSNLVQTIATNLFPRELSYQGHEPPQAFRPVLNAYLPPINDVNILPTCTGAAFNVRRCSELVTGTRKLLFEIKLDVCSCQKRRANSAEIRCINGWSSGNACCVAACCCLLCETISKHPSFA